MVQAYGGSKRVRKVGVQPEDQGGSALQSAAHGWQWQALDAAVCAVIAECTECGLCAKRCAFLQRYGTPKAIAEQADPRHGKGLVSAYECSLCGLCHAVCPFGVNPAQLFLEQRREAVLRGLGPLPQHRRLLSYERKGTSRRYSLYALPDGCTTVFFPGCTFAGTRAEAVLAIYELFRLSLPDLGIVLDCCTKPSHDLGRQAYFLSMFGEMRDFLVAQGVRTVFVACPNCYKVFQNYGSPLQVRTVYERLTEQALPRQDPLRGTVTLHDPCVLRHEPAVQDAVRSLVHHAGLQVLEMPDSRERTLCCGEGGGVGVVDPGLARQWSVTRARQAEKRLVVTSCAGCAAQLRRFMPTVHVVDLVLNGKAALDGKARLTRPPFTYWKRLRLKKALKQRLRHARLRERPLPPQAQ